MLGLVKKEKKNPTFDRVPASNRLKVGIVPASNRVLSTEVWAGRWREQTPEHETAFKIMLCLTRTKYKP